MSRPFEIPAILMLLQGSESKELGPSSKISLSSQTGKAWRKTDLPLVKILISTFPLAKVSLYSDLFYDWYHIC